MSKGSIVNVVATASLNKILDLDELGKHSEILHDPKIYGGRVAYFKASNMEGKVSIFSSGKMISIGTKSEEKAISELEQAKRFLVEKRAITDPKTLQHTIHNIVVVVYLEKSVDIEELSKRRKMIYEPDQFPAGILKIDEPHKATILLYSSGKAIMTGIRSSKHIEPLTKYLENAILSKIQGKH